MSEARVSASTLMSMKASGRKISMLTAYDFPTARIVDRSGVDGVLVGDSCGMVIQGHPTTVPVTMDEMIYHTALVARGVSRALVVGDMPFLSFQVSDAEAVRNAGRFLKEGGAQAVKVEGGGTVARRAGLMVESGIPVMGHVGLTPQAIHQAGGYRVRGRSAPERAKLIDDALALQEAGCFSLVLECIPWQVAQQITEQTSIPTIGIGAGPYCDGQVLVLHDMIGLFEGFVPRHVRRYAELGTLMEEACTRYVADVKAGRFPSLDESHSIDKERK
jgi:3-methyl-2-oxobutanoate hydroxymethyltransferase